MPPRFAEVIPRVTLSQKTVFYLRAASFLILNVSISLAIVLVQLPSLLLILPIYTPQFLLSFYLSKTQPTPPTREALAAAKEELRVRSHRLFRQYVRQTEKMYGCMVVIIAWLFAPVKLVVTGDYEMLGEGKRQVVMANHQIYPDWWYMWCLFHNRNAHGDVKILLIKYLKHIPIFGWGMRFFEFIFMNRKWALDKENLTSHLRRAKEDNLPLMLLLYPEGNLNTPNNRESCRAYAKKMDISEDPKHVVLPKSTGLKTCLEALAPEVHELFDVTVGYSGLTADQVPYDEYLAEQVFFGGIYPAEVHLHIRRFDVAKLPGFEAGVGAGFDTLKDEGIDVGAIGAERFNLWLRARWMQKDELMDGFYKNGVFGGEEGVTNARKVINVVPRLEDCATVWLAFYLASYVAPVLWKMGWGVLWCLWWVVASIVFRG